jgi:type IV pilus assembly protein PilE
MTARQKDRNFCRSTKVNRKGNMMKQMTNKKGFTLIELMIVVGIVAILVALALPSYSRYIRKANRGEAQQLLMNWANNQEIWRANDSDYAIDDATELLAPTHDNYDFSLSNRTATTYTLTATAKVGNDQENDTERGSSCTPLHLNQSNAKTHADCW